MQYKRKSKIFAAVSVTLMSVMFLGTLLIQAKGETAQTVVYTGVEVRQYEEGGHSYLHNIKTNNTTRGIAGCQRGMLAFDKDGNPLEIDWQSLDSKSEPSYFYLYEDDSEIAAGATQDLRGGWSLNLMGNDLAAEEIAYVLYCDKEIMFEDGTVWSNPDFETWRSGFEGKTIDVADLDGYYPHEQKIDFSNGVMKP